MQVNDDGPQAQLNPEPEQVSVRSMGPIEFSLFERIDRGMSRLNTMATQNSDNDKDNKNKYTGKSTIIAKHGWLDCGVVIQYKYFEIISKIILGTVLLLNILLACHRWQYTAIAIVCVAFCYSAWNFISWRLTYSLEDRAFRQMFLFEGLIGALWTAYLATVTYFFINKVWYMILIPLLYVALQMYMIYSIRAPNSYFVHRSISIVEAIQIFGISLKLMNMTLVDWSYTLTYFGIYSLYLSVVGFVCLLLYCNMRCRDMKAHPFLPGLLFFALYLAMNGMVYQQVLNSFPFLYSYPERLQAHDKANSKKPIDEGVIYAAQGCVMIIVTNIILLLILFIKQDSVL